MHAAGTITAPLPAASIQAIISLIAASGLRLGEALGLDRDHVALQAAMLTVNGKNGQQRLVPLHSTTVTMLTGYAARRDRLCPAAASPAFFITRAGHRLQQRWVQQTFARLLILAGIAAPPARRRPAVITQRVASLGNQSLRGMGRYPDKSRMVNATRPSRCGR